MILLASMLKLQHFHIDSTATTARITTYSLLINTIQNQNRELFMLTHTMIWAGRFGAKKKVNQITYNPLAHRHLCPVDNAALLMIVATNGFLDLNSRSNMP